ncbi:MAG: PDZ domain-containing protein [Woeseiaceae bacterium]|nr:PDZ domain-containing protein [Woeseiaceae bacterium]
MDNSGKSLLALAVLLLTGPALAQQPEAQADVERRQAELRQEQAEIEERMREAEQQLAEAARQIAELSSRQLPRVAEFNRKIHIEQRPRLGVTIGSDEPGPVPGVQILGVSPGGAADDSGLRAGDTITAINGESMTAESAAEADRKLLDFMAGVEEGDELKVDYLRDGKAGNIEVSPRMGSSFSFDGPSFGFAAPVAPMERVMPGAESWVWFPRGSGFGDMELVTLTEKLGKYFGTDKGLLVVRAPENESFKLEDGDVIQRIDGREPTSVSHAMRILGSYQTGEKFEIEIMRERKRQTLSVEMPDNRQSRTGVVIAPRAVMAVPAAPAAPPAKVDERT